MVITIGQIYQRSNILLYMSSIKAAFRLYIRSLLEDDKSKDGDKPKDDEDSQEDKDIDQASKLFPLAQLARSKPRKDK